MTDTDIFIITGEASGDLHGAHLMESLAHAGFTFYAMGGKQLAHAGANIVVDSTELAVVGFFEVFGKLKAIRHAFKKMLAAISSQQPAMVILIDYPGFNLRLAKAIKIRHPHITILYYISPQIWAWRYHRIHHIKRYIDLMAVIFPFEVEIYQKENVPVKFVGNPLVGKVTTSRSPEATRQLMGLQPQEKLVGIMPGSRKSELQFLLPTMLKAAEQLKMKFPTVRFMLPLAPTLQEKDLQPYLKKTSLNITMTHHRYDAIAACDTLMVASGTATLEVAMLKKPMVIIYKLSSLTYLLGKFFIKMPYFGLCNIVAGEKIVPELLQVEASPHNIAAEIDRLLSDTVYAEEIATKLAKMNAVLAEQGNAESLSEIVCTSVEEGIFCLVVPAGSRDLADRDVNVSRPCELDPGIHAGTTGENH